MNKDRGARTIQMRGDGHYWRLLVWYTTKSGVFDYLRASNYILYKDYRLQAVPPHTLVETKNDVLAVSLRLRFDLFFLPKG